MSLSAAAAADLDRLIPSRFRRGILARNFSGDEALRDIAGF